MKIYAFELNKLDFNIEYIFIYLINHILNIYNFIFFIYPLNFIQSYMFFFHKNEIVLVYKLN